MRFIILATIILLSSCENRQETIANRQQAIQREMEDVKAAYFKKTDSLQNIKETDTSMVKQHEIAEEVVLAEVAKSLVLLKLQKEYDSLGLAVKK